MVRTLADCADERDDQVVNDIANFGWHVVHIEPTKDAPAWSFTIGLFHTFMHPEVLMFGLDHELSHRVINGICERIKAGNRMEAELEYPDILAKVRCIFKAVHRDWYKWVLGYARWFYESDEFPVLQCVWPDKQQHYPWEPAFKAEWVWAQPLLFHADPITARATGLLESLQDSAG
jgi:hypothetical protein